MIPNLTFIVAAYVLVRFVMFALRQLPDLETNRHARAAVLLLVIGGSVLVVVCTLDTIGIGLGVGSAIDAQRKQLTMP